MTTAVATVEKRAGTGLLVFGYVFALLGGVISIAVGRGLTGKIKNSDGQIVYVYDKESRRHGAIMITIGILVIVLYSILTILSIAQS
jgi:zinc transporter ZupT